MIQSKEDYLFYLEADRVALLIDSRFKRPRLFQDEIWKFQRSLRKVEFFENCEKSRRNMLSYYRAWYEFKKLSLQLGFTIPRNVFGPGLSIAHQGTIVVQPDAKVGENCRIHHGVTIGSSARVFPWRAIPNISPKIGDNVFIGAGAVIMGDISIADGIAIGANSYVNKSFLEPNITIAGCPAKKVSNDGSENLWIRATNLEPKLEKIIT